MNKFKLLIIVIALSLASGCGYRLAGKADLDPVFESTHVSYQGRGHEMAELLEKQFEINKYRLVSAEEASALVEVLYEITEKEILSVDEDGKVREYELILRVGIDVKDSEGKRLVQNQEVRLTRDFLFDINDVLGKSNEENAIYQEMRADAARLILYRLQAISLEIEEKV
ncbi:MAG: LPS assembly lipoprotein LptE [Gammaproteobacteria bacterium]|nr:LPS assembly lipoprotein LptE [Gammaproteobacteria bacterium]